MESKAAFVLGREKEIQVLSDFVKGNVNKALAQLTYRDAQGMFFRYVNIIKYKKFEGRITPNINIFCSNL